MISNRNWYHRYFRRGGPDDIGSYLEEEDTETVYVVPTVFLSHDGEQCCFWSYAVHLLHRAS